MISNIPDRNFKTPRFLQNFKALNGEPESPSRQLALEQSHQSLQIADNLLKIHAVTLLHFLLDRIDSSFNVLLRLLYPVLEVLEGIQLLPRRLQLTVQECCARLFVVELLRLKRKLQGQGGAETLFYHELGLQTDDLGSEVVDGGAGGRRDRGEDTSGAQVLVGGRGKTGGEI